MEDELEEEPLQSAGRTLGRRMLPVGAQEEEGPFLQTGKGRSRQRSRTVSPTQPVEPADREKEHSAEMIAWHSAEGAAWLLSARRECKEGRKLREGLLNKRNKRDSMIREAPKLPRCHAWEIRSCMHRTALWRKG